MCDVIDWAENLDIKGSVISKIFADFGSKAHKAFDNMKEDGKVSKDVFDAISASMESRF